ncbi:MAG: triphosphoribosyl-dephospho-CoA synthase [Desulfurococcales archaeon]|nr:triphosphoribosyl-dephospho-CoA synthase [Desulfurococcales archaeon]
MRGPLCARVSQALALGAFYEPLVNPKPGGTTRVEEWRGMNVYIFHRASAALGIALHSACNIRGCRDGRLWTPITEYLNSLESLGLTGVNANSGTFMLLVHLALAWDSPSQRAEDLAVAASRELSSCSGLEDAKAYYYMLSRAGPGYLGKYEGPLGDVRGEPRLGLARIVRNTAWDLVHRELAYGYPLSLQVYRRLLRWGVEEQAVSKIILELLGDYGDTLIARRHGWRAYYKAMSEARIALKMGARSGDYDGWVLWLRKNWSRRGWTPGAVLDIVATGLGLYFYSRLV